MILESELGTKRAPWLGTKRPCKYCEGRILFRKEDPARVLVRHEKGCLSVLQARGKVKWRRR